MGISGNGYINLKFEVTDVFNQCLYVKLNTNQRSFYNLKTQTGNIHWLAPQK